MRKILSTLVVLSAALLLLSGCSASSSAPETTQRDNDIVTVSFDYEKQTGYSTNQFAVWIETVDGAFVKTLYVTEFTASGGYEKRPDAISTWVARSGLAEKTEPDAVSGATPKTGALSYVWDLTDESGARVADGTYKFFVEGTLRWKNEVLFSGEIELNGSASTTEATAEYTYTGAGEEPALTSESPENAMIGNVKAEYIPPKQS